MTTTMVAATQQCTNGYTSFPQTGPHHRSYSHESEYSHQQPTPPPASSSSSPWFFPSCNPNPPDPETDHPPSPDMETIHHKRRHGESRSQQREPSPGRFNFLLNPQDQRRRQHQHQQQQKPRNYPNQQQRRPNYPTTIEFTPSHDDHVPFDEDLNQLSLEDTFGFDKKGDDDDDVFERLYTGQDEEGAGEEEGTLQSSVEVELNPYSARDFDIAHNTKQKVNQNKNNLANRPAAEIMTKSIQRERDSIFRSERNPQPSLITPTSGPTTTTSYEKKINENMQLISPNVAMDRRRSTSKPRSTQARSEVASPSSSIFTAAASAVPLHRTNTGTSLHRNNTTGGGASLRSRNRSTSRSNHRSRSRATSSASHHHHHRRSRRSRSRSTSIAASSKKEDDYHQSLFRGAALIREQLLRSMASADQAMDDAEREFNEEMAERGDRQMQLRAARQSARRGRQGGQCVEGDGDNGDIDFDYSFDHSQVGRATVAADGNNAPSPSSRGGGVRFAPSQDSSALETESRRLDTLMTAFTANSSMSSSNAGMQEFKRTSSDKENDLQTRSNENVAQPSGRVIDAHDVISPTSSLGLSSPTVQRFASPTQTNTSNEYASRYFQADPPKPIVATADNTPNRSNKSNTDNNVNHKHQVGGGEVNEALAHAQRAGIIWRSLVGNHVRFPSKWETILPPTSPRIYSLNHKWSKWYYVARHRVKGDKRLNSREFGVRSRRSGGRILMRIVVREMHTQQACREIVIGCFHPNSKGIRRGDPLPEAEDVREVWMAVRWLMDVDDDEPMPDLRSEGYAYEGVVDNFLLQNGRTLDYGSMGSALGHRKAVNNENVRAIFGDQPPMTTVDLHEDEIAEIVKANGANKLVDLPALMLLKLFLFSK